MRPPLFFISQAISTVFIITMLAIMLVTPIQAAAVRQYDSSFDRLFQFNSYCQNRPECYRRSDGSVILTQHGYNAGGFFSYNYYQHGQFQVPMRLPGGYSGGIIPCFYLMAPGNPDYHSVHDEIDFEFIGGQMPRDIIMHTNLLSGGSEYLEQFSFPFDPSSSFHNYTIKWTSNYVAWMLDGVPIRITWRQKNRPFPSQHLNMQASIWNPDWTDLKYSGLPVSVYFRQFQIDGCAGASDGPDLPCAQQVGAVWTSGFSDVQMRAMRAFRKRYLVRSVPWRKVQ